MKRFNMFKSASTAEPGDSPAPLTPLEKQAPDLRARREALDLLETRYQPPGPTGAAARNRFWLTMAAGVIAGVGFGITMPMQTPISVLSAAGLGVAVAFGGARMMNGILSAARGGGLDRRYGLRDGLTGAAQSLGLMTAVWFYGNGDLVPSALVIGAGVIAMLAGWVFGAQNLRAERLSEEVAFARSELITAETAFADAIAEQKVKFDDRLARLRAMAGLPEETPVAAE